MTFQTFDRFQGLWWGSIIGQIISHPGHQTWGQTGYKSVCAAHWIKERQKLASLLSVDMRSDVKVISEYFQAKNSSYKSSSGEVGSPVASGQVSEPESTLPEICSYCKLLLTLTPLIFVSGDGQNLLQEVLEHQSYQAFNLDANSLSCQDLLLWQSLVELVLFEDSPPHDLIYQGRAIGGCLSQDTNLLNLLEFVNQQISQGTSLHQLWETLKTEHNYSHLAIAFAWYCFFSTPQDVGLSLGRAIVLPPLLRETTAALTGTLSGAYNGMTSIPLSWRKHINNYPEYVTEEQTIKKLAQHWLGTYSLESKQDLSSLGLIVPVQLIQRRKSLSIISQTSN